MINFDIETGQVFIRNFDQGVVETLGGYIDLHNGGKRNSYYIDIPAADPMKVQVVFNKPFQLMKNKFLPQFSIQRGDPVPALSRWHSVGATQYRIGKGTPELITLSNGQSVSGYAEYESLPQAFPFDIPYTIKCLAHYEHEAIPMVKKVLSTFKPYSKIIIKDSLSQIRTYTVFATEGFQDVSEIADIQDRMKAYSITIRVEAELDLSDPEINKSVKEFIFNQRRT